MKDSQVLVRKPGLTLARILALSLSWCFVIATEPVYAWNPGGHKIVNYVAWLQLDDPTRTEAIELIKEHERFEEDFIQRMPPSIADGPQELKDQWVFLQATAWPDIARNQPRFHHGTWHYVNFPHFVSTKDKEGLDLSHINLDSQLPVTVDNEDGLNILQAILLNEQVLNSNSSTDPQKAIGLCWLMHLIGDVHQPLHSTALFTTGVFSDADGDRGGNQIEVDGTNLHAYWDNLLGNPTTIGNIGARAQGALDKFGERGAKATHFMNALHWAQESHHLAKQAVYTKEIFDVIREHDDDSQSTIKVSLTPEYKSSAEWIATQRIVEAGFRLARTIEEVVGEKG
jgi:hypothetical protein